MKSGLRLGAESEESPELCGEYLLIYSTRTTELVGGGGQRERRKTPENHQINFNLEQKPGDILEKRSEARCRIQRKPGVVR